MIVVVCIFSDHFFLLVLTLCQKIDILCFFLGFFALKIPPHNKQAAWHFSEKFAEVQILSPIFQLFQRLLDCHQLLCFRFSSSPTPTIMYLITNTSKKQFEKIGATQVCLVVNSLFFVFWPNQSTFNISDCHNKTNEMDDSLNKPMILIKTSERQKTNALIFCWS